MPDNPVIGPYVIDGTNDDLKVTAENERGEPCKGGKCRAGDAS